MIEVTRIMEFLRAADPIDRDDLIIIFNNISLTDINDFEEILIQNPSLTRDLAFFAAKYRRLFRLKEKELKDYKNGRLFELREAYEEGRIREVVGCSLPLALIENYVESEDTAKELETDMINLEAVSKLLGRLDYQADGRTSILVQLSVNRRATKEDF